MPDDDLLTALTLAVADGAPVDWDAAESTAASDSERRRIRDLRLVANIATGHEPPRPFAPPATWGPLRVEERIGRGRFGDVYRAWDRRLDREVAVKFLKTSLSHAHAADDFIEEGRLLAKVRHPNVVTVYGAEQIDGIVGVWMELVRGMTLEDELAREGLFSDARAASISADVARALAAVHAAGLIHRDVKAQNVMRDQDGRTVLMDFGTGLDVSAGAEPELAGTPIYLAPEVLDGATATARSDIYSVGVLAFHLVTGLFPVTGRTLADLRDAHRRVDRSHIAATLSTVRPSFARVLDRALAADPVLRCQTASDLATLLDEALGGDVAAPWSAPHASRLRRVSVAVVAVGGLVAAGWAGMALRPRPLTDAMGPHTICDNCRIDPEPSVSTDGRMLAYVDSKTSDLGVRDLVTGRTTIVAAASIADDAPTPMSAVLSPDGRQIAFDRSGQDDDVMIVAPTAGAVPRLLTRGEPIAWSPDGRSVLATVRSAGEPAALRWLSSTTGASVLVSALADCQKRGISASVSPDGRWIAHDCAGGSSTRQQIAVIASNGGPSRQLTVAGGAERDPVWSPDGLRLFFTSDLSGTRDLWSVPIANGQASGRPTLVRRDVGASSRLLAMRGDLLFFHEVEDGLPESSIVSLDQTTSASAPVPMLLGVTPTWSPDGTLIALIRSAQETSATPSVVVHSLVDGTERVIRHDGLGPQRPLWFGDGRSLLVYEKSGEDGYWSRLTLASETFERLMPNRADPKVLTHWAIRALAPDGRTLYFGAYRGPNTLNAPIDRVVAADLRTGTYRTVVMLPGTDSALPHSASDLALAIGPAGRTLAIEVADPHTRAATIWSMAADGTGPLRPVATSIRAPRNVGEQLDWTRDGRFLVFTAAGAPRTANGEPSYRVMRVPVTGGAAEFTGASANWLWTLSVNPDGSRVVFDGSWTAGGQDRLWTLPLPAR